MIVSSNKKYDVFWEGSSNDLEIIGLKNEFTGLYENDAVIEVTLKNNKGLEVQGTTWPQTFDYIQGSNGRYMIVFPDNLQITAGDRLTAEIRADAGTGYYKKWYLKIVVLKDDD